MLTGLYPSTHGNAWVGGHDIRGELSKVQMSLGVCPQFDLLWPELTVEEHLLFYARLKGVPKELERTRVQQSMKEVKLTPFFQ
jgi:ABC-type multidrug transport system ATPase subunit